MPNRIKLLAVLIVILGSLAVGCNKTSDKKPSPNLSGFDRLGIKAAVQNKENPKCEGAIVIDSNTRIILVQTFALHRDSLTVDTVSSIDTLSLAPRQELPSAGFINTSDPAKETAVKK